MRNSTAMDGCCVAPVLETHVLKRTLKFLCAAAPCIRHIAASFMLLAFVAACTDSSDGTQKKCVVGGCSKQLCLEQGVNVASNCMWSDSYRCYQTSGTCERQGDGKCDWTPTDALSQCLTNANSRPPFLPPSFQP